MPAHTTPNSPTPPAFDLIGDIHGHAAALRSLLAQLGYAETDGVYRHPAGRRVIFLGDFIDRGPAIRETLQIGKAMHDAGTALAVMGNHEHNALCYATPDDRGGFLRSHNAVHTHQHAKTLEAFAEHPDEWALYLEWFRCLPLCLELPGLRVVHASWDDECAQIARTFSHLDTAALRASRQKGTALHRAVEVMLKGIEVQLPAGLMLADKEGHTRAEMRVRWWLAGAGRTYAELCIPHSPLTPTNPIPEEIARQLPGYPAEAPPVFIGHYWLSDAAAQRLAPNVACLDYSVAKGGFVAAYRWDGESAIADEKFFYARASNRP